MHRDLECTTDEAQELMKKLGRLSAVTEDRASENTIRWLLTQRVQRVEEAQAQLKQNFQQINYYVSNPEKIPPELRSPTDQTNS